MKKIQQYLTYAPAKSFGFALVTIEGNKLLAECDLANETTLAQLIELLFLQRTAAHKQLAVEFCIKNKITDKCESLQSSNLAKIVYAIFVSYSHQAHGWGRRTELLDRSSYIVLKNFLLRTKLLDKCKQIAPHDLPMLVGTILQDSSIHDSNRYRNFEEAIAIIYVLRINLLEITDSIADRDFLSLPPMLYSRALEINFLKRTGIIDKCETIDSFILSRVIRNIFAHNFSTRQHRITCFLKTGFVQLLAGNIKKEHIDDIIQSLFGDYIHLSHSSGPDLGPTCTFFEQTQLMKKCVEMDYDTLIKIAKNMFMKAEGKNLTRTLILFKDLFEHTQNSFEKAPPEKLQELIKIISKNVKYKNVTVAVELFEHPKLVDDMPVVRTLSLRLFVNHIYGLNNNISFASLMYRCFRSGDICLYNNINTTQNEMLQSEQGFSDLLNWHFFAKQDYVSEDTVAMALYYLNVYTENIEESSNQYTTILNTLLRAEPYLMNIPECVTLISGEEDEGEEEEVQNRQTNNYEHYIKSQGLPGMIKLLEVALRHHTPHNPMTILQNYLEKSKDAGRDEVIKKLPQLVRNTRQLIFLLEEFNVQYHQQILDAIRKPNCYIKIESEDTGQIISLLNHECRIQFLDFLGKSHYIAWSVQYGNIIDQLAIEEMPHLIEVLQKRAWDEHREKNNSSDRQDLPKPDFDLILTQYLQKEISRFSGAFENTFESVKDYQKIKMLIELMGSYQYLKKINEEMYSVGRMAKILSDNDFYEFIKESGGVKWLASKVKGYDNLITLLKSTKADYHKGILEELQKYKHLRRINLREFIEVLENLSPDLWELFTHREDVDKFLTSRSTLMRSITFKLILERILDKSSKFDSSAPRAFINLRTRSFMPVPNSEYFSRIPISNIFIKTAKDFRSICCTLSKDPETFQQNVETFIESLGGMKTIIRFTKTPSDKSDIEKYLPEKTRSLLNKVLDARMKKSTKALRKEGFHGKQEKAEEAEVKPDPKSPGLDQQ